VGGISGVETSCIHRHGHGRIEFINALIFHNNQVLLRIRINA
jgi:hypothetical protein